MTEQDGYIAGCEHYQIETICPYCEAQQTIGRRNCINCGRLITPITIILDEMQNSEDEKVNQE